jgi:VWFA-related protein
LRPQDRIEVAEFGSGFKVIQRWFSRTDGSVNVPIQTNDSVCYGTDFYGAIRKGIDELQSVKGRKGVVILSDGAHQQIPFQSAKSNPLNGSRYVDAVDDSDFQKTARTAANNAAVLYFVAVDTDLNPDRGRSGTAIGPGVYNPEEIYNKQQIRSRIEQLASVSGGRVVFPEIPEDVIRLYEQMARELGSSYSLGYAPPADRKDGGAYHKIEVRLRDRSLKIRQSRDGYTAAR